MEHLQKRGAAFIAAAYIVGVAVSAIHLSRFGIQDLAIAKISYIFSGAVCIAFVSLRIVVALAVVNFGILRRNLRAARSAIYAALKSLWIFRIIDQVATSRYAQPLIGRYTSEGMSRRLFNLTLLLAVGLVFWAMVSLFDLQSLGLGFSLGADVAGITVLSIGLFFGYVVWLQISSAFRAGRSLRWLWRLVFIVLLLWDVALYAFALHPLLRPAFGGGAAYKVRLQAKDEASEIRVRSFLSEGPTSAESHELFLLHESAGAFYITNQYRKQYGHKKISEVLQYGAVFRVEKSVIIGYEILETR